MALFSNRQEQLETAGCLIKQPVQNRYLQLCLVSPVYRDGNDLGTQPMLHNPRRARFAPITSRGIRTTTVESKQQIYLDHSSTIEV